MDGGGQLSFLCIEESSGNPFIEAPIPTVGDHAFVADEWYHVAASYDASGTGTGYVKLYWTRLSVLPGEANELTDTTVTNGLGGGADQLADIDGTAYFYVGGRHGTSEDNLHGLVDEVRISGAVLGPDEFIFSSEGSAVPEPAGLGLIGLALLGLRRRRS